MDLFVKPHNSSTKDPCRCENKDTCKDNVHLYCDEELDYEYTTDGDLSEDESVASEKSRILEYSRTSVANWKSDTNLRGPLKRWRIRSFDSIFLTNWNKKETIRECSDLHIVSTPDGSQIEKESESDILIVVNNDPLTITEKDLCSKKRKFQAESTDAETVSELFVVNDKLAVANDLHLTEAPGNSTLNEVNAEIETDSEMVIIVNSNFPVTTEASASTNQQPFQPL